jgi:hypothetical protein
MRSFMEKGQIQQVLNQLPDPVDIDEFVEKLYLLRKIEIGEQQLAAGKGISHEEAKKRLEPWLN